MPFIVVVQSLSCIWLCNPMDCSISDFPVLHYLAEFAQTHVHWFGDAIQPSHSLSPLLPSILPSIRILPMSQLFTSGGQSIGVSASVLPMNIQDWLPLGLTDWISLQGVQGTLKSLLQHRSSKASILQCSAFFVVQYICTWLWKNRSFDYMDLCWQSDVSAF